MLELNTLLGKIMKIDETRKDSTRSRKNAVKFELDKYGLLTDGPKVSPLDLLESGNVDIARLEGGGSFGESCLIDGNVVVAKQAQVLVLRVTEKVMFSHRHEKERRSEFVLSHRFCSRGLQILSFFSFFIFAVYGLQGRMRYSVRANLHDFI